MCPGRQVNRCGGSPCTAVTATCTAQAAVGFDSQRRAALSLTPQSRPTQNSRYLQDVPPSCCGRRVAVWSGACRTDHQGLEKRHGAQAACEPGGGGCGGVPVHPARLHTHRTSPAQALLTILMRHAEPNV